MPRIVPLGAGYDIEWVSSWCGASNVPVRARDCITTGCAGVRPRGPVTAAAVGARVRPSGLAHLGPGPARLRSDARRRTVVEAAAAAVHDAVGGCGRRRARVVDDPRTNGRVRGARRCLASRPHARRPGRGRRGGRRDGARSVVGVQRRAGQLRGVAGGVRAVGDRGAPGASGAPRVRPAGRRGAPAPGDLAVPARLRGVDLAARGAGARRGRRGGPRRSPGSGPTSSGARARSAPATPRGPLRARGAPAAASTLRCRCSRTRPPASASPPASRPAFAAWRGPAARVLALLAVAYVVLVAVATLAGYAGNPRYLVPAITVLAVLAGVGAAGLPWPRLGVAALLALTLVAHAGDLRTEARDVAAPLRCPHRARRGDPRLGWCRAPAVLRSGADRVRHARARGAARRRAAAGDRGTGPGTRHDAPAAAADAAAGPVTGAVSEGPPDSVSWCAGAAGPSGRPVGRVRPHGPASR